jgi:hypothetical protein
VLLGTWTWRRRTGELDHDAIILPFSFLEVQKTLTYDVHTVPWPSSIFCTETSAV